MFTWDWFQDIACFCAILLACAVAMGRCVPKRRLFVLRVAACAAVLIGESFLFRFLFYPNGIPNYSMLGLTQYLAAYVTVILSMLFCYRCDIWGALFCGTVSYCIEHISAEIMALVAILYMPYNDLPNIVRVVIRAVVAALLYLAVYFLFIRKNENMRNLAVDNKLQVIMAAGVVVVCIYLASLASLAARNEEAYGVLPYLSALSAVFAIVGIFMQFGMSSKRNTEDELSIIKCILSQERENYLREKNNMEFINIKCHDLRHWIDKDMRMDKSEIGKIEEAINAYDSRICTGCDAIDVILAEKADICRENDIKLTCLIDGRKFGFMPVHEIYSLIGNALENAIDAVLKLDPERRVISMVDSGRERIINLRIENYCDGGVTFSDGLPVTAKDPNYHGFGMKSMRYIVESHGGAFTVNVFDDIFAVDILLFPEAC